MATAPMYFSPYGARAYPGPVLFVSEPTPIGRFLWRCLVIQHPRQGNVLGFEWAFAKAEWWHHSDDFLTPDFRRQGGPLPDELPALAEAQAEHLGRYLQRFRRKAAEQLALI